MTYKVFLCAARLALPLSGTGGAQARSLGKIRFDAGLSQSDLSAMETAAMQLAIRWTKPATRATGAIPRAAQRER